MNGAGRGSGYTGCITARRDWVSMGVIWVAGTRPVLGLTWKARRVVAVQVTGEEFAQAVSLWQRILLL